jgi:O-antigen/teichoic acid export membrane protein
LIPTAILTLFGATIFSFVFGSQWETAGLYTQLLAPAFFFQFVVSSVSQVLIIMKRASVQLVWDIIRLASVVGLFISVMAFRIDDLQTIGTYSIITIITYGILFILQWHFLNEFVQQRLSRNE